MKAYKVTEKTNGWGPDWVLYFLTEPTKQDIIVALKDTIDEKEQDLNQFVKEVQAGEYDCFPVIVIENRT